MKNNRSNPIPFIFMFYLVCFGFRTVEYFFIRTDQTIIGEAFIHKLIGIILLAASLHFFKYTWEDIGFQSRYVLKNTIIGLLLGGGVFTVAYFTELIMQTSMGNTPSLQFYITSYAIQGNRNMQGGTLFILLCIVGNIINVIMEEGVFRGLFVRLMEEKYSFAKACVLSSFLFGVWHIIQPIRNVFDGEQSLNGAIMSALLLIVTSMLLGVQYCMLLKLTGSLWAGMAAHFVNNTIINLLHVSTNSGADELQFIRIAIAQTISFIIVLLFFLFQRFRKRTRVIG